MKRIRFIDHEGHRILLVDLTGCNPDEIAGVANEVPVHVTREPDQSVLLLADFTGAKLTREAIERVKIAAALDRRHIKRSAWVFNGNMPKPLHDSVQAFSSRDIPKFGTREAAVEFLVSGNQR
jgi:hypothetical protein